MDPTHSHADITIPPPDHARDTYRGDRAGTVRGVFPWRPGGCRESVHVRWWVLERIENRAEKKESGVGNFKQQQQEGGLRESRRNRRTSCFGVCAVSRDKHRFRALTPMVRDVFVTRVSGSFILLVCVRDVDNDHFSSGTPLKCSSAGSGQPNLLVGGSAGGWGKFSSVHVSALCSQTCIRDCSTCASLCLSYKACSVQHGACRYIISWVIVQPTAANKQLCMHRSVPEDRKRNHRIVVAINCTRAASCSLARVWAYDKDFLVQNRFRVHHRPLTVAGGWIHSFCTSGNIQTRK